MRQRQRLELKVAARCAWLGGDGYEQGASGAFRMTTAENCAAVEPSAQGVIGEEGGQ